MFCLLIHASSASQSRQFPLLIPNVSQNSNNIATIYLIPTGPHWTLFMRMFHLDILILIIPNLLLHFHIKNLLALIFSIQTAHIFRILTALTFSIQTALIFSIQTALIFSIQTMSALRGLILIICTLLILQIVPSHQPKCSFVLIQ